MECKYMFMFTLKNLARKGLTQYWSSQSQFVEEANGGVFVWNCQNIHAYTVIVEVNFPKFMLPITKCSFCSYKSNIYFRVKFINSIRYTQHGNNNIFNYVHP